MKKKFITLLLTIFFILPCAFGFTACANAGGSSGTGGSDTGSSPDDQVQSGFMYAERLEVIIKDNFDSPNYYSCVWDNDVTNKEAFTVDDIKVYYIYSNGKRKLIEDENMIWMSKKLDSQGNELPSAGIWSFMETGETSKGIPGRYGIRFYSPNKKLSVDLIIDIFKGERPDSELDLFINEFNGKTYDKTKIKNFDKVYEVEFAQNELSNSLFTFSASWSDLTHKEDIHNFIILENKYYEEYLAAEDRRAFLKNVSSVGFFDNYAPPLTTKHGTFLLPGDYFIIAQYKESVRYVAGFSKPIKIKVVPSNIAVAESASVKGSVLFSPAKFKQIQYAINDTLVQDSNPFNINAFKNSDFTQYCLINYFDGTSWKTEKLSTLLDSELKVHAYKSNGLYYLASYVNGEWYKYGTTTKISASSISFVNYTDVFECFDLIGVRAPLFISVDHDAITEDEKQYLSYYDNINEIFNIELLIKQV